MEQPFGVNGTGSRSPCSKKTCKRPMLLQRTINYSNIVWRLKEDTDDLLLIAKLHSAVVDSLPGADEPLNLFIKVQVLSMMGDGYK